MAGLFDALFPQTPEHENNQVAKDLEEESPILSVMEAALRAAGAQALTLFRASTPGRILEEEARKEVIKSAWDRVSVGLVLGLGAVVVLMLAARVGR